MLLRPIGLSPRIVQRRPRAVRTVGAGRLLAVVGGIAGIDAAYHLQTRCKGKSWLILEARGAIGGTWDLFRYPGVRSDSDMYALGFPFRPWASDQSIVEGPAIRDYVEETAHHY